ncbi:PAS domain S-box protein [bacterium]|nr:PAS domain S-box protein [bacterium]
MATPEKISTETKAQLIEELETLKRNIAALEESHRATTLAKKSLQKRQKMLNSILDNSSAVIYVKDVEGRYLLINERYETLFNISKEDIIGKTDYDLFPIDTVEVVRENDLKVLRQNEQLQFEEIVPHEDGLHTYISVKFPLYNENGFPYATCGISTEITERKQAEEALHESENKFRTLYESTSDAVMLLDEKAFFDCNEATLRIFGCSSREEFLDKHPSQFSPPLQPNGQDSMSLANERIATAFKKGSHQFEWMHCRLNGEEFSAEVLLSAMKLSGKDVLQAVVRDITDRKQAEKELTQHRLHLEELVRERTSELAKTNARLQQEITERKQMEKELRESEERFELAVKGSNDGLWDWPDINKDEQWWSSRWQELLGYKEGEVQASISTLKALLHPDDLDRVSKAWNVHFENHIPVDIEYRLKTKSGQYRWFRGRGEALWDENGKPVRMSGSIQDITERKQAEKALRESEERYRHLVEKSPIAILVHSEGKCVFLNPEAIKILGGKTTDDFIGKNVFDYVHADSLDIVKRRVESIYTKEKSAELLEEKFKRLDRKTIDVEVMGSMIDFAGKPASQVIFRDISERKRAEEALRESEIKYRSLIENSNDAIYLLVGKNFEVINQKFSEYFGVTPEEVKAPEFTFMDLVAPRSKSLIEKRTQMQKQGKKVPSRYEFSGLRKDGIEIDLEVSVTRVPYQGGMATQGILRDITERKKLEAQLRQSQKLEAIGTLAGGIAHDFNNILMAILGYTEMAQSDIPTKNSTYQKLEQALKASNRAKELVQQILTFSRQIEHEFEPVQIHPVVKEAVKLLRASLPTTIEIRQHIDNRCGYILGDPTQIHQIIMNLCTNAFHAMRENGGILEISLEDVDVDANYAKAYPQLSPGEYVRLAVRDTGHGIDAVTLERIFDPFFTTKAAGEGTGMGLAVTHGVVSRHGGQIVVNSETGKGSTFQVYLPRLQTKKSDENSPLEPISRGTERILLVDDEAVLVEMQQEMLGNLGYEITPCTSSLEALETFRADPNKFDLVITDQTMPNLTGVELAGELMIIKPNIRIILMTGYSEVISPEQARKLGIREYIMKPVVLRDLSQAIRKLLDQEAEEVKDTEKIVE